MLTHLQPEMATLIAVTRPQWKMSLLLLFPSTLIAFYISYPLCNSPPKYKIWYTHKYFNLHKLVFIYLCYCQCIQL